MFSGVFLWFTDRFQKQ